MYRLKCASHSLRTTNCPWWGRGQVIWPITKFWGSNHITGTAEPEVVKFCTRVGYINSMQQDDISPTKGRGYGHVTVLKFHRLSWCSASRGFVSDSWATCTTTTTTTAWHQYGNGPTWADISRPGPARPTQTSRTVRLRVACASSRYWNISITTWCEQWILDAIMFSQKSLENTTTHTVAH